LNWQKDALSTISNPRQKKSMWINHVKDIFDKNYLSYLFSNPTMIENNIPQIKQRIADIFSHGK
jgi:hypothetical protein